MERGKSSSGRGSKSKTPQFPADLYALGSKSGSEPKPRTTTHTGHKTGISQPGAERDRKRDGPQLPAVVPSKKSKLSTNILPRQVPGTSSSSSSTGLIASTDTWESIAIDVEPPDIVSTVMEAYENEDQEKWCAIICGTIKLLRGQRFKSDPITLMSLAYLCKVKKHMFTNEIIVSGLGSLLKRETPSSSFKSLPPKMNVVSVLLAITILTKSFQDVKRWPESLLKLYLEDAGGDRNWVDHELSKSFVENITYSLSTKQSTVALPDLIGRPEQQEDDIVAAVKMTLPEFDIAEAYPPPVARFRWNKEVVESIVLESVKEQLSRRQSIDLINRNFLRMLTTLCGVSEIRLLIAPRLEAWIQNPKLMRSAQELLMSVCVNCSAHTMKDVEVISSLIKMRLKTKALSNYYLSCIRELVVAHPDNLGTVLKHTIYNELSSSRNPNNMPMLSVIFQCDPSAAAEHLADIFLELLMNRDDYLRPLRALLRELARVLRHELKLQTFCRGLMSHTEPLSREVDNIRAFTSTIDIISLCIFLAVMPHAKTEKKDLSQIEKMQTTIATIQADTIWWLQETALSIYKPLPADFVHAIHKVLLLEPAEQYYKTDNWPPEQDRALFMRMASEVPVFESTIITLLVVGLSKEHPLSASEALDLTLDITKRAAAVQNPIMPVLKTDKIKILDLVFNLSAYRHPENIDLPVGYKPPSLAISALYWKGWMLLLILSSHNPTKFGALAWNKYPTLRVLMEMCITSHFSFPPGFDDLQLLSIEKQGILEFETHLAAASTRMEITEQTSLLLSQLVTMDPLGPPRRPPPATVEIIKGMNTPLRLGHLLCRSRQPDFLLDIIQRQGSSSSMPWLADLVHNSDGALNHLPVQCLCEFLLSSGHKQEGKYLQLLKHLQSILTDPNQDSLIACEVLDYFLRRLSSPINRSLAISGLKQVISPLIEEDQMEMDKDKLALNIKEDPSWLMEQLPNLPHFEAARPQIVSSLRSACQVENEPNLVTAYLCFLAQHANGDLNEMGELVLDMAQLIVERSTIMASILPPGDNPNPALDAFLLIFYNYLTKAREPRRDKYTWSESQDQVLVTWPSGEECTVHILVVHAMVILLTYGPEAVTATPQYNHLLDTWFPKNISRSPKGFLVDTSEEALLIPDWLKLRMIRSHVPRLVKAALTDLDMAQLILFIQSFGIPIASMSKLLATLDNAVINDQNAVGDAVIDKTYMIQLVEVQHKRGAKGGETFTRVLDLQDSKVQPMECEPIEAKQEKIVPEKVEKVPRIQQSYMTEAEGVAALENLFGNASDVYTSTKNRILFTNLQRTLVHESRDGVKRSSFVKCIMGYLLQSVTSDRGFVEKILSRPQYSCPLFRLLASVSPNSSTIALIAKGILKEKTDNPRIRALLAILNQYLNKQQSCDVEMEKETEEMDTDAVDSSLTDTMNKLIACRDEEAGHLVDQLVKLEPEILGSEMELQMKLLFCIRTESNLQCRPYLLTLLTHHASWRTLSNCVENLLKNDSLNIYEPTPVLDFLKALTCNPKLWQGREKHTPKHYRPEDVLNLNLDQLKVMTDYILEEAVNIEKGLVPEANKDTSYHLSMRLSLLYQCIYATNIRYASDLAVHLSEKCTLFSYNRFKECTDKRVEMARQLLVQLYLKIPSLITQISEREIKNIFVKFSELSVGGCCTMDVMSHNLITALSETLTIKEGNKRSQEYEIALRKMASTHPLLVLRQLPLIAAVLRGRLDLEWSVFRFRGHWLLFQQIANLLDLLQPIIYHNHYATSLQQILNMYLELFQNYVRESGAVGPLLTQIVIFLQGYIKHNIKQVQAYLQSQAELISDLQDDYPPMRSLCMVISGLKGGNEVIVTPTNLLEAPNLQWEAKIAQLNKDDPYALLSFVDYNSNKKPALLGPIFPTMCSYLTSSNSQVRSLAHTIVMRYMRHNPRSATEAIPSYLACLDSDNPEVVLNALEKLPEVVVCSQELAAPVLQKIFSLGVNNNINTSPCILKTITLLNLQSAC